MLWLRVLVSVVVLGALLVPVAVLRDDDRPSSPESASPAAGPDRAGSLRSMPLERRLKPAPGARARNVRTAQLPVSHFSMVAVVWDGPAADVEVRTRTEGRWTPWQELEPLTDLAREGNGREGSELVWVGPSRAVQVSVTGRVALDLELVLIDPGVLPTDADAAEEPKAGLALSSAAAGAGHAPRPELRKRARWGADESMKNGKPTYLKRLKQVHVHHTASSNDYAWRDVPGIIRGMYRYHTQSLGWFDIGYNFLVDRFGRAWAGRSGGPGRLVRGAHTLGFNHASTGVAIIGNHENKWVSKQAKRTLVHLAAWKLDKHGRRATGKVGIWSKGSDRYAEGARVRLPRVDGHRDTNHTACPGVHLYDRLPGLRKRTQRRIDRWN